MNLWCNYTLADLRYIGIDMLGVTGVFFIEHVEAILMVVAVLIAYRIGLKHAERKKKKLQKQRRKQK